jgi:hypothetical protein
MDVVAIGNPLLDIIVNVEDHELNGFELAKGRMHLIDEAQSEVFADALEGRERTVSSGGSAANVAAGMACLGGSAGFQGVVGKDDRGDRFAAIFDDAGIDYHLVRGDGRTGHAFTFITPDHERTFATHLGCCRQFSTDNLDRSMLDDCRVLHLEGFQFEHESQRGAALEAMRYAKHHGALISIDLADSLFVEDHRDVLADAVGQADVVFANEREAKAYTGGDFEALFDEARTVCVTLGKAGSVIDHNGRRINMGSFTVDEVNTNGAGDMYDAGILYALVNDVDLERGVEIASYAAAQVVGVETARLERSLADTITSFIKD